MYKNIVCAIDGSELSSKALRHALALAAGTGTKLTAVTVTEPSVIVSPGAEMMMVDTSAIIADLDKAKAESARQTLAEAETIARAEGLGIDGLHVANSPAAEGILTAARELGADLVVMGSHGRRGLGRLLLGSQAAEVLAHSSIPVLIVK
jgi:nucleotide-binding universal stress UspA family protein